LASTESRAPDDRPGADSSPAWHQALAYAICGQRLRELGRQDEPDLADLVRVLSKGADLASLVQEQRRSGAWPHPVPNELLAGLGWAQFSAALTVLITRLDLGPGHAKWTLSNRPPDADERRLLHDVPPHHLG
jgi:hypothetical protein